MTVSVALGWTGAILIIPAFIAWIAYGFTYDSDQMPPRVRILLLVLALLFTIAILTLWIAGLWQAVGG